MKLQSLFAGAIFAAGVVAVPPDVSRSLQNILANTDKSNAYTYPTDLTRGIVPVSIEFMVLCLCISLIGQQKAIHSHKYALYINRRGYLSSDNFKVITGETYLFIAVSR